MNDLLPPPARPNVWRQAVALAVCAFLAACANYDFGEVHPVLVTDGIHDWVGRESGGQNPVPASRFEYTDDERALRDLAYPLIEPPYDRQQWYSVAGEYGLYRSNSADHQRYYDQLQSRWHRSPTSRYSQLIDDIRNDITRMSQFFETAGRVIDIDNKRRTSLSFISNIGKQERVDALRRIRENAHVVAIVRQSLSDRIASYRFALERLVIATPSSQAVEAERAINLLQSQVARYRNLPPTWVREPSLASTN
ncbi:MAG TPA: hypothetical protein VFB29_13135 [Pseudolabrys sp.]|nr:hypothetical protein [Pseudolabrys sp.]